MFVMPKIPGNARYNS